MNLFKNIAEKVVKKCIELNQVVKEEREVKHAKWLEKEKLRIAMEEERNGVRCPHCRTFYSGEEYYRMKLRKDLSYKDKYNAYIDINFIRCNKCKNIFMTERNWMFGGFGSSIWNTTYKLEEKNE